MQSKSDPILADFKVDELDKASSEHEVFDFDPQRENLLTTAPGLQADSEVGTPLTGMPLEPLSENPTQRIDANQKQELSMPSQSALPDENLSRAQEPEEQPQQIPSEIPIAKKQNDISKQRKIQAATAKLDAQHPLIKKKADYKLGTYKDVAILWQVPEEPVSVYHIEYGYKENMLDKYKAIPVKALQKVSHSKHGTLFRFVVKGVPQKSNLYFRLQAENQNGRSRKSSVLKAN
jgi:hypothetical protein